jgi:hypothetical protein
MKSCVLVSILLLVVVFSHSHALIENTLCYCDCCKGETLPCAPTRTYLNSSVDSCSILNCFSQCFELPQCKLTDEIAGRSGSTWAYCSSYKPEYSSNPVWDGNYEAVTDSRPIGCCYVNRLRITSYNSSLQFTGAFSCNGGYRNIPTQTLPIPTGNTLAFWLVYKQEIAITLNNNQMISYNIDDDPRCYATLNRTNTTFDFSGNKNLFVPYSSSTGITEHSLSSSNKQPDSSSSLMDQKSSSSTETPNLSWSSTGAIEESSNSAFQLFDPFIGMIIPVILLGMQYTGMC